jgi:hypothetical protein
MSIWLIILIVWLAPAAILAPVFLWFALVPARVVPESSQELRDSDLVTEPEAVSADGEALVSEGERALNSTCELQQGASRPTVAA